MPIFQPRNRIQILRDMIARVVARSRLSGLTKNSVFYHILAAAAAEDAEQYVQMARLRRLFSIDKATGSDLDERAKEIVPSTIFRTPALFGSTTVVFSRPGTTGTVTIPVGTQVAASDVDGQIRFRTTSAGEISAGNTASAAINVVATTAGVRGNVAAGAISRIISRIPGISSVTNATAVSNARDREGDPSFRARIKSYVQAISRGTPNAIEAFARNVILADGRRVLFATIVEPIIPNGKVDLYIDDGTGAVSEVSEEFIGTWDVFVSSITDGGERNFFVTAGPVRDDGALQVEADTGGGFVALVQGTDYEFNFSTGQLELSTSSFPTGLPVGGSLRAQYRYYTGLIAETQRIINGDPNDELRAPGVRAAGVQVTVRAPATVFQSLVGTLAVRADFDPAVVANNVETAIQNYINGLDIGDDVIVAEIIERAMSVDGMFNFNITSLTGGSPAADQVILSNQIARITAGSITLN